MGRYRFFVFLCVSFLTFSSYGYQPDFAKSIPDSLKPWTDWVMHDLPNHGCPSQSQNAQQKHCVWPALLQLNAQPNQLQFEMMATLYAPGWLTLPGGEGFWAAGVQVNGISAGVINKKGKPSVFLEPGRYAVTGHIPWAKIPSSIFIPKATGLIHLTVNDQVISLPRRDNNGRLWLVEQKLSKQKSTEDKLSISVFRHLQDGIPFLMETRLTLEVSGNPREALLGVVQLPGFELTALQSQLPARVEPNGRLRIQLRPGSWSLSVTTRSLGDIASLPMPESDAAWPSEELWSFQPKPEWRLVRLEGAESIDPQQTNIPEPWKRWKAYRLLSGQLLNLVTLRKGDPEPAPNRLQLDRTAWLNFSGEGILFQDHVTGSLSRDWRLSMNNPYQLGKVSVSGEPQVVTELDGMRGVEVRRAALDMMAVSSVNSAVTRKLTLPASGWAQDFEGASISLNMPPGWQLLAASDADVIQNAWLNKWKVWDVFLVLITTAALIKLRGVVVALISALGFVLIYPEEPGILWLWLNVIAVLALLSVLKPGSLMRVTVLYGRFSVLLLLLVCIPFLISQARTALYPQLERGYYASATSNYRQPASLSVEQRISEADMMIEEEAVYGSSLSYDRKAVKLKAAEKQLVTIDPNAAAQTGPSVPTWYWNHARVYWNGPVTADQTVTLFFMKPMESRIVAALRVVLLILIALGLFQGWRSSGLLNGTQFSEKKKALGVLLVVGASLLGFQSNDSWAEPSLENPAASSEIPSPQLLQQLKERLVAAKQCAPHCVSINQARMSIQDNRLTLLMDVYALEPVQVQLPHANNQWLLDSVTANGKKASIRYQHNNLWLALEKGSQRVVMNGRVDVSQSIQVQFPTKVNNLLLVAPQWLVRGMDNGRIMGGALYLEPKIKTAQITNEESDVLPPNVIKPFVRIKRRLRLGLNWYVETRVERLAPTDGAIKLQVPLISGESVTSQRVAVKNGLVTVSLAPGQRQFLWYSSLEKQSMIELMAAESHQWVEEWELENSTLWHVDYSGLAAIKPASNQQAFLPVWYPMPGETLRLDITRPKAAGGVTTTIDQANLVVRPGRQESSYQLDLNLRSSKGTEQRIQLQPESKVLAVTVDGEAQPSQEQGTLLVIPINPGEHHLSIQWRAPTMDSLRHQAPKLGVDGSLSNIEMTVEVPRNQWVLLLGGPQLGPAVLIWGELIVVILLALGLSRIPGLPLKTYEWVLLAMGLCAGWIEAAIIVVMWFVALRQRRSVSPDMTPLKFNLMQLALVGLTGAALITMLGVIPMGLMGSPDMGIVGNGSSHYFLRWYQDQAADSLPGFWWVALPLWCYRLLMLLWSLWLAVAVLKWLKWAWASFSEGGIWKKRVKPTKASPTPQPSENTESNESNE